MPLGETDEDVEGTGYRHISPELGMLGSRHGTVRPGSSWRNPPRLAPVISCPSCGKDNPEGFTFCGFCTTALAPQVAGGEERKTVTVLFCDLVGSTTLAEGRDPEDVRAMLHPYHELLRGEIEGFGGTVEKFIGDAVMAVFGAPVAHEDDAERAVRAALRIFESLEDLNTERDFDLSVRIGVNTGEAVVALGVRPEQGEGMVSGDVVNTAARLESGAPANGIAVGEDTYRATKDIFEFEPLEPIHAKGKAEPLEAWQAVAARARFGTDITRHHDTNLVGREAERTLLESLLDRSIRDASCQLVTITGEPGVGKSRMVYELLEVVEDRPELVTWRQGRCLPYGEGITFWALGEIVKAEAGILESDSRDEVGVKLERALEAHAFDPAEREWFKARLAPLVGGETTAAAEREESFTAWLRFLEGLADTGPATFVFEDLHWADDAMLEFLEHVADWSEGVPMLIVCTARPELSKQHPTWAAGLRNASTVNLQPLSATETSRLVSELLDQAVLPVEVQAPIVERAGGNPLYAEEFVRMLKDRGLLVPRGRSWELAEGAEIPFPDSVHGLIAARLDALPPERKSLLHDASVVGKVFWAGALSAIEERPEGELRQALHELTRQEFVRAARQPSMEGEAEYAFSHMVVRDVAYSQIPRAARARKHQVAADWLEERAGERVEDLADVLAYHYVEAAELARASGGDVGGLAEQALRFLVLSGDRAANLDPTRAATSYEQALQHAPAGHPVRPKILIGLANVEYLRARFGRARELLEEATPQLQNAGDLAPAAEAKVHLYRARRAIEPTGSDLDLLDEAISDLEALPPGRALLTAYAYRAGRKALDGLFPEAIVQASRAISLAEDVNLPVAPDAFRERGHARCFSGDLDGLDDIRHGIELALEQGLMGEAAYGHNDLALVLAQSSGPAEALIELEAGASFARRSGILEAAVFLEQTTRPELLFDLGRWDDVLRDTTGFLANRGEDAQARLQCQIVICDMATWRHDFVRASHAADEIAELVTDYGVNQAHAGLGAIAHMALATGDLQRAANVLQQLDGHPHVGKSYNFNIYLPELVRIAIEAVGVEFAQQLASDPPPSPLERARVAREMVMAELAEARGELEDAAVLYSSAEQGWRVFSVPERAQALLGQGRCLMELGKPEAASVLKDAREVFASLGAQRFIPETDALLERAMRLSS